MVLDTQFWAHGQGFYNLGEFWTYQPIEGKEAEKKGNIVERKRK